MSIEKINPNLRNSVEELRDQREKSEAEGKEHWPLHDAPLESFAGEFQSVIPNGEEAESETDASKLFIDYIGKTLDAEKNTHLAAIELGGPGANLFKGFPKGFFEKTIGVSLEDAKNPIDQTELEPSHHVITGDLFRNDVYKKIQTELEGKGADLIISRMYGGLDGMTSDPAIWGKIARTWYGMLREKGLMLVQYRLATGDRWISDNEIQKDVREKLMKEWVSFIQNNYREVIEMQLSDWDFRLLKKDGAPKELPLLPSFDKSPIIEKKS